MKHIIKIALLAIALVAVPVSAHVVVKPSTAGVGSFQTFTIGVPSEKESATVGMRILIPQGMEYVTPNVKPGWKIAVTKMGNAATDSPQYVTEINWTGGSIPAGQRDDFIFSAKVPASETTLVWKAYQTYADGSVVAWERSPDENLTDFLTHGPYSQTEVVDDLATTPALNTSNSTPINSPALSISIVALVFALTAILRVRKVQ